MKVRFWEKKDVKCAVCVLRGYEGPANMEFDGDAWLCPQCGARCYTGYPRVACDCGGEIYQTWEAGKGRFYQCYTCGVEFDDWP